MVHDGHRERLRNKFLEAKDSFEDHELLELLLFYSIPRANTNEIAHDLLDRFGSLQGVFNADVPALMQVEHLGEKSAIFLKTVSEILLRYQMEKFENVSILSSPELLQNYMFSLFVGTDNEKAYILLFNKVFLAVYNIYARCCNVIYNLSVEVENDRFHFAGNVFNASLDIFAEDYVYQSNTLQVKDDGTVKSFCCHLSL